MEMMMCITLQQIPKLMRTALAHAADKAGISEGSRHSGVYDLDAACSSKERDPIPMSVITTPALGRMVSPAPMRAASGFCLVTMRGRKFAWLMCCSPAGTNIAPRFSIHNMLAIREV